MRTTGSSAENQIMTKKSKLSGEKPKAVKTKSLKCPEADLVLSSADLGEMSMNMPQLMSAEMSQFGNPNLDTIYNPNLDTNSTRDCVVTQT